MKFSIFRAEKNLCINIARASFRNVIIHSMSTDFSVIKGREETSLAVEWHIKHKISPPTRVRDCHKWAQFVLKWHLSFDCSRDSMI